MPTAIYGGADSDWKYSTTSVSSGFNAIAQLEKADGPKRKRNVITTPVLGSAALAKLPGEADNGQITLSIWLDLTDASHVALYNSYVNGSYFWLKNTHPNTKGNTFYGFNAEWNESGFENDGAIKVDITFEVSGATTDF